MILQGAIRGKHSLKFILLIHHYGVHYLNLLMNKTVKLGTWLKLPYMLSGFQDKASNSDMQIGV